MKFPLLSYAFEAIGKGGNMPCILNAANEVAVAAFLNGDISFVEMPLLVRNAMDNIDFVPEPTLQDLIDTNSEAVALSRHHLRLFKR